MFKKQKGKLRHHRHTFKSIDWLLIDTFWRDKREEYIGYMVVIH